MHISAEDAMGWGKHTKGHRTTRDTPSQNDRTGFFKRRGKRRWLFLQAP
jgi:hypothetical protein